MEEKRKNRPFLLEERREGLVSSKCKGKGEEGKIAFLGKYSPPFQKGASSAVPLSQRKKRRNKENLTQGRKSKRTKKNCFPPLCKKRSLSPSVHESKKK